LKFCFYSLPVAVEGTTKPMNSRQHNEGVVEPISPVAPSCIRVNALPPEGSVFYFAYGADSVLVAQTSSPQPIGNILTHWWWNVSQPM